MSLPEYTVESASGGLSRKVWILDPSDGLPDHVAIFLDGEYYVNHMDAPAILCDLQSRGDIPPLACGFVSHVDGAARHQDLTCSEEYAHFIARDIMGWMRGRYPNVPEAGHLIGGTSLGGLAAAFTALSYPEIFSSCLSHSGSFWWNDEWLASRIDDMPRSQARFWSSVGDQETATGVSHPPSGMWQEVAQIATCERFAEALRDRSISVHHRLYSGGHEFDPWREELPDALRWLFAREPRNANEVPDLRE